MQRPQRGNHERLETATREGLGAAAFGVAWAEGRAMTLEQAVEYALNLSDPDEAQRSRRSVL